MVMSLFLQVFDYSQSIGQIHLVLHVKFLDTTKGLNKIKLYYCFLKFKTVSEFMHTLDICPLNRAGIDQGHVRCSAGVRR